MNEYSPEFKGFNVQQTPQVMQRLVDDGATKVADILTPDSVKAIWRLFDKANFPNEKLDAAVAEDVRLANFISYVLGVSHGLAELDVTAQILTWSAGNSLGVHLDYRPCGVTALLPLYGQPALFAASDVRFTSLTEVQQTDEYAEITRPKSVWAYGPTDMILIAQGISRINGSPVHISEMWHEGVGPTDRSILAIDINRDEFQWPGVEVVTPQLIGVEA